MSPPADTPAPPAVADERPDTAQPPADTALPLAGGKPERCDAAANRVRILEAARQLFAERGAEVSMDEVAAAAGVGKGTVFRRFGDREGLTEALLDEEMRGFQDAFLRGPAPLGPGAPAAERLLAFCDGLLALLDHNLELALASSPSRKERLGRPYEAFWMHLRVLLAELRPDQDPGVLADLVLGALSSGVVRHLRRDRGEELAAMQAAAHTLLRGILPPAP